MIRLKSEFVLALLIGLLEALLLARLVLQLFAARPDNGGIALLAVLTAPIVRPLAVLDATQPQFGSVLEFSTLLYCIAVPLCWIAGLHVARRIR